MNNPFIIGICGGAGKSTHTYGLTDSYPKKFTVFHLDDYFRPVSKVPKLRGMVNYNVPDALYSDKMIRDLSKLKSGKSTIINTKSPRLNPDFLKLVIEY
jgi:uridine kinase